MASIFLSYAREDEGVAADLYQDLKKAGYRPWMDKEDLLPGEPWEAAIRREINDCSAFIALMSTISVDKKGFFQKEIKFAIDVLQEMPPGAIFIVPARLDDCRPRHEIVRDLHWVDLYPSYKDGFSKILAALEQEISISRVFREIRAEEVLDDLTLSERLAVKSLEKEFGCNLKVDTRVRGGDGWVRFDALAVRGEDLVAVDIHECTDRGIALWRVEHLVQFLEGISFDQFKSLVLFVVVISTASGSRDLEVERELGRILEGARFETSLRMYRLSALQEEFAE